MKLLTYQYQDQTHIGMLSPDMTWVYPLSAFGIQAQTMEQLIIESDRAALNALREKAAAGCPESVAFEDVLLLPPIPEARQAVICLENNYYTSEEEKQQAIADGTAPKWPAVYYKKASSANRPDGEIPSYPDYAGQLDFEPGLAMITAADIRGIPEADAGRYIFGYTIINNIISRELVQKFRRPVVASSLDGFLPMGPWIVTSDEFEENPIFDITASRNGRPVLSCSTSLMKFKQNYLISDLCRYSTLKAASIIWLGTPHGCIQDQQEPKYLSAGDRLSCTISRIGTLRNTVV